MSQRKSMADLKRRSAMGVLQIPSSLGGGRKSQGKIASQDDDDEKVLLMKKKRQENISKKINMTTNKSQMELDLIYQEHIEGSKRESSRRDGTIRQESRREGTLSRRMAGDDQSIRRGEGSRRSVIGSSHNPSVAMHYRSESHRGTKRVGESSHISVDEPLGSNLMIQSRKKSQYQEPSHRSSRTNFLKDAIDQQKLEEINKKEADQNMKVKAKKIKSIIPESVNEDQESSFQRLGSRKKSMEQSQFRQGSKRQSFIRDSINEVMGQSGVFNRSVSQNKKSIIQHSVYEEVIQEEDYQAQSKEVIKELMEKEDSERSHLSDSSSVQRERTIRMIHANLITQPIKVLQKYDKELQSLEKQGTANFKKVLEFIDRHASPSQSGRDKDSGCDLSEDYTEGQVEQEHSKNMLLINQSFWHSASRDQMCSDIGKRLENLVKNIKFHKDQKLKEEEEEEEDYADEYYDDYPDDEEELDATDSQVECSEDEEEEEESTQQPEQTPSNYVNLEDDYEVLAQRDAYSDYYSLKMVQDHDFAWIMAECSNYHDRHPFLLIRKFLFVVIEVFYVISYKIVSSRWWIFFILSATVGNIISYIYFRYQQQSFLYQSLQRTFLYMYTTEVVVKLLGHGWKKYLENGWNLYDTIILILYGLFVYEKSLMPFDVSTFRVIRIPFFLSHMSKSLYIMLTSLQESVKYLLESMLVVLIFSGFFTLIQLHLFQGLLHQICFDLEHGMDLFPRFSCGYQSCPSGMECYLSLKNPNVPTSFDDVVFSYGQTLRTISQNMWTIPLYELMNAFHPTVFILFLVIIFVGERFCLNLLIAVLKTQYAETAEFFEHHEMQQELKENQVQLNLRILIDMKLYQQLKDLIERYQHEKQKSSTQLSQTRSIEFDDEQAGGMKQSQQKQEKKEEKEIKLLSARQKNIVENYKKKMREAFENSSWVITCLLPQQQVQKRMQRLIRDQENTFLQYYDLQLYYRFRSMDFLSLKVCLKNDEYKSSSSKQVLEQTEFRKKEAMETEVMRKRIPFHYQAELYKRDEIAARPTPVQLPIMKRKFIGLQTELQKTSESKDDERNRYQAQQSKMPFTGLKGLKDDDEVATSKKKFQRTGSLVSQHVEKLFKGEESMSNISDGASSSSEENKAKQEEEEEPNTFKLNGDVLNWQDMCEIINANLNAEKEEKNEMNYEAKYMELRINEAHTGIIKQYNWSGDEVLTYSKQRQRTYALLLVLNVQFRKYNWKGQISSVMYQYSTSLAYNKLFQISIDIFIMTNTIILATKGIAKDSHIQYSNYALNFVLMFEISLKLIANFNWFVSLSGLTQTIIILLSTFEMIIENIHLERINDSLNYLFLYVQVLKAVLFFRVIYYNEFAYKLMIIAYKTMHQYLNLTILMFFVILNYALLGVQIFGDHFNPNTERGQLHSFGDPAKGWVSVFNISTQDNWYSVFILGTTYANKWATIAFLYTMVYLINYLLKELLMAIILDEFSKHLVEVHHDDVNDSDEGEEENLEDKLHEHMSSMTEETFQITSESEREHNKKELELLNQKQLRPHQFAIDYFRKMEVKMKKSYFNLTTLIERLTANQKKLAIYENVECEMSFFIFRKKHILRQMCFRLVMNRKFELFFILNFIITILTMMAQTYFDHEKQSTFFGYVMSQSMMSKITFWVNIITNSLIILEGLIKMIAFGCTYENGTYFSDFLRGIDFIYCCIYMVTTFYYPKQLQLLSYLGYLRPLRLLTMFETFKQERLAINQSINDIINILLVMVLFWFVFAIFGIQIYKGQMGYCGHPMNFHVDQHLCEEEHEEWKIYPVNFENIFQAMSGLFIIATLDEFGPIYQVCMNGTPHGPVPFANEWPTYIYFVSFCFIGSMFFWSFFAGILFIKFRTYKAEIASPDLTQNQLHFIRLSQTILNEKTYYSDPPRKGIRLMAQKLNQNVIYRRFMVFCLVANILVLCLFTYHADRQFLLILNYLHHSFSALLIFDTVIKLLTYHIIRYMGHIWRKIEMFISLLALVDMVVDFYIGWYEMYLDVHFTDVNFRALRVFFMLRDLRVVLVIQEFIGIQRLLHVLWYTMGTLMKLLCFFVLVLTVYSFIGCRLYGLINKGEVLSSQRNFANFFNAMLTLFQVTTRNDWRGIFIDCTVNHFCHYDHDQCGPPIIISTIYYFSFLVIQTYSLMNLFILALVEQFEHFYASHSSIIETYIENIDKFRNVWCKYSAETKGLKMHTRFLGYFLLELGEPLGSQHGDNLWDAAKAASSFEIRSDRHGYVHFRELLYETVKNAFHSKIFKGGTYEGFRQMKQHDKKTSYRLQYVRVHSKFKTIRIPCLGGMFSIQSQNLREYLYVFMALKAWKTYTTKFIANANEFTNSYDFTEDGEILTDPEDSDASSEQETKSEEIVQAEPKNITIQSETSREKDDCLEYDIDIYEQKPKVRLKVSFLDRIYQQRVKDNILFVPKQS